MQAGTIIARAFANDTQLTKRVFDAIDATPQYAPLFEDIAKYHLAGGHGQPLNGHGQHLEEPASKKRRLLNGTLPVNAARLNQPRHVILEARDISFSLPQRKKLHLGIVQYGQDFHSPSTSFAICTRSPSTNEVELEVPVEQFAYALRLPVPEKAQKQYNFCLLPKNESTAEPLIWTVNHGPLKSCHISSQELAKVTADPERVLEHALDMVFQRTGVSLTYPTENEFASARPESHRKGDKAYHVKAFRGSKDGYLFFLQNGIFFGFKKPLSFFAFDDVESISYTSVLQRTFNLNISYKASPEADAAVQEVEFSMIDQADFPGIDAYIKRHQLQDASMAEVRRAKKTAAASKHVAQQSSTDPTNGEETDERTELEKAQQQMDDEEDEEEEDYDPGDESASDGSSRSESEEEEEYDDDQSQGRDLVQEELGSEAEDVELSGSDNEPEAVPEKMEPDLQAPPLDDEEQL